LGLPQDYAEAVRWWRESAEQGNVLAWHALGSAYANGRGVAQDDVQAYMWTTLAASAATGNEQDTLSSDLRIFKARMTVQQIAEAQRLAREWKPTLAK